MTIGELGRWMESQRKKIEREQKEKASFTYIQADLIGRSISRLYSKSSKMPSIEEVFPSLFTREELEEQEMERRDKLSIMRFEQFALAHNQNFNGGERNE